MKNKILNRIGTILISITILIFTIIIGANEKELRILPISILLAVNIIYLLVRKIVLKENIAIKNKLDVSVLGFILITFFPLIFKTYCSLEGTVQFIIKYCYIYSFYLVIRNTIKCKNQIDVIALVTILSSAVIIIFGLDMLWNDTKYFKWIIKKLDLLYKETTETKPYFASTFGYRNTAAIYLSFCIFLAINQIQTSKTQLVQAICIVYIPIAAFIIYLTGSRTVTALVILFVVLYFLIYYRKQIKEKKKIFIKLLIVAIVLAVIMLIVTVNVLAKKSTTYEFTDESYLRALNYKFEANTEYTLTVELESEDNKFKVSIIEMNKYYVENVLASEIIENIDGTIEIKFKTTEDFQRVDFSIENPYEGQITLKKFYIDGEECVQHFKYIPNSLGKMLKLGVATDPSLIQRLDFWKDSLKIFKSHPIIGQGGDTWKSLSTTVEDYPYTVKETHSYLFELLIEYGIIGLGIFVCAMIIFVKAYLKKPLKGTMAIFFGILLVVTHSFLFDFNMSFILMQLLVWGYIGALVNNEDEIKLENKIKFIIDIITIIIMICILVILILSDIAKYAVSDREQKKDLNFYDAGYQYEYIIVCNAHDEDTRMVLKELQSLINKNPYYMQSNVYRLYWAQITKSLDDFSEEELAEYIKFINDKYKTIKFSTPMYVTSIFSRVQIMADGYLELVEENYSNEELLEQIDILKEILIDEYEYNLENIKAINRNGITEKEAEEIINQYDEIMENIM